MKSNPSPDAEPEFIVPAAPSEPDPGTAPEVSAATENLIAWDDPVGQDGFRHKRIPLGDEDIPSVLVEEGLEEADRETRLAAHDGIDEEEEDLRDEDDSTDDEDEDDYPTTGITS